MVNRKKAKLNKQIYKYIIYTILLLVIITIAILIPEQESSLKNPYRESTEIKDVIDDILGNSGVQRLEVIETSEESVK